MYFVCLLTVRDSEALLYLEDEITEYLNPQQKSLLRKIGTENKYCKFTDFVQYRKIFPFFIIIRLYFFLFLVSREVKRK